MNEHFQFGPEETAAFQKPKAILSDAETFAYLDVDAETNVMAHAGRVGLGAMLLQEQDGVTRVVSYARRSLSLVERRYSKTEKEALGRMGL